METKKYVNHCGESGCKCECDRSCGGDIEKCTSEVAVAKQCTHDCWCICKVGMN